MRLSCSTNHGPTHDGKLPLLSALKNIEKFEEVKKDTQTQLSIWEWFLVKCCFQACCCDCPNKITGADRLLSVADRFENKHGYRAVPLTAHGFWVALALSREQYMRIIKEGEELGSHDSSEILKEENCGFVIVYDPENHPVKESAVSWFLQDPFTNVFLLISFSRDLLFKSSGLCGEKTQTFMDTIYNGIEDLVSGKKFFWSELIKLFSFPHISFYNSVLNGKMQVKRFDPKLGGLVPAKHRMAKNEGHVSATAPGAADKVQSQSSETETFQCIICAATDEKDTLSMGLGYTAVVLLFLFAFVGNWRL